MPNPAVEKYGREIIGDRPRFSFVRRGVKGKPWSVPCCSNVRVYKHMDYDDEQTRDVYAYYGLAMYLAQILEHGIVNALVILRLTEKDKYTRQDIDEFMEGRFQKPLGALLKHLRSEVTLPPDLESTLTEALNRRNYLAHQYFREKAESFVIRSGRAQMLHELQVDQQLFEKADEQLEKALAPFRAKHGVTDSVYEAEYKRMCQRLGIEP